MAEHVKAVAVINIVFGGFGVLGAIIVFAVFGGLAGLLGFANLDHQAQFLGPLIGLIGAIICIVVAVVSLPGLIAGIGLLYMQNWARILMIVLSVLHLFSFPLGTALGIYGLWVLLNGETERLFQRQAAYAPVPGRPY